MNIKVQNRIEKYFQYETISSFSKQSKRMKNALNSLKRKNDTDKQAKNVNNSKPDELILSDDEIEALSPPKQGRKSSITITRNNNSSQITKKVQTKNTSNP
jgi:hypothetical protein